MAMATKRKPSLADFFEELDDAREPGRNFRHPLVNVLVTAVIGVACGQRTFTAIADFVRLQSGWFGQFLDLRKGTPSPYPRWTPEIRPYQYGSKPTQGSLPRRMRIYPCASAARKLSAWSFIRQLRGPRLRTWAWWSARSRRAVAAAVSPSSLPQSSTGRLDVIA